MVKHTEAKRGFVLLPRRWVVGRSIGWAARFRRLARDHERLADTLASLHYVAFVCLMLSRTVSLLFRFITGSSGSYIDVAPLSLKPPSSVCIVKVGMRCLKSFSRASSRSTQNCEPGSKHHAGLRLGMDETLIPPKRPSVSPYGPAMK